MGVLHKLVFMLGKLDPRNQQWRQRQIDKVNRTIETAEKIDDSTVRENTIRDIEREIDNINEAFERNELDYGRKLYLIENCIYGVDIQPIAVQIAKLRFFILARRRSEDGRLTGESRRATIAKLGNQVCPGEQPYRREETGTTVNPQPTN